ncbi:MAG: uroporphyrinogen-III synthase [Chloroflexi bacterium]|nr:uroporphyrinogen-III synthase [Chloroflexota bacterium]
MSSLDRGRHAVLSLGVADSWDKSWDQIEPSSSAHILGRPLQGKRVLVTRSQHQAETLTKSLRLAGATVVDLPIIEIEPAPAADLDDAFDQLDSFDWIAFTSANGVAVFWDQLWARGLDSRALHHSSLAAIGPATERALRQRGLRADFVPGEHVAEALSAGLVSLGVGGGRVLLLQAAGARETLAVALEESGATVNRLPLYRNVVPVSAEARASRLFEAGVVDVVTFTSSSTVENLLRVIGERVDLLRRTTIACIGPITARTAEQHGLTVHVCASEHTAGGLVAALCQYFLIDFQ